jgi:hypothetical protein
MDDDDWYKPNAPQAPPRVPRPGEPLCAFVRERDKKRFDCELRFNGESYGCEAQIFEQGELFTTHGRFVTRAMAVQWAEEMRNFFEVGGDEVEAG